MFGDRDLQLFSEGIDLKKEKKGKNRFQEVAEEGTLDNFTFKRIPNEDCSPGHIQFLYKMCQSPNLLMYSQFNFFLSPIFKFAVAGEEKVI